MVASVASADPHKDSTPEFEAEEQRLIDEEKDQFEAMLNRRSNEGISPLVL